MEAFYMSREATETEELCSSVALAEPVGFSEMGHDDFLFTIVPESHVAITTVT
jgi:hypothetical protein